MKTKTGSVRASHRQLTVRSLWFARFGGASRFAGVFCALLVSVSLARAATLVQEFFLPLPEQQIYTADSAIQTTVGTTFDSIFSIVVTGSGTVVYYDQWEDGYETDLANPTQASTLVWGDGNDANGIAPGFAHDPNGLSAGTVLALRNNVSLPRNPSTILYDARDRVAATKALVITRAAWPVAQGSVFAGSASVYSTIDYGTNFICPVGQDITNKLFGYVGMFVMAAQDNTSVTIDPDGPGTNVSTTIVLNRGESYLVNGNVRKGGTINSTKPVQAHAIIGHLQGSYATDWFNLVPVADWDSTYYTPVPTSASGNPAYVYLYNRNSSALTINYTTRTGSGSFSVPATNVYQYQMPVASGAKFISASGSNFFAVCTVAANNAADTAFNWGFTLLPKDSLTTEAVVGWGPGSSDGTVNGSPAWVTPIANTTIYVDYNGDRVGPNSINGLQYDTNYTLIALESKKVFDPDKDQTAMRIFTVDGTLISAAWGEDPDTAAAGNPYIDAGTTVLPFPVPTITKSYTILTDAPPTGLSTNDVIQYTVTLDNKGLLPLGNTVVIDAPTTNLQYVTNSTTLDGVAIADNPGPYTTNNTAFPLDAYGSQGYTIPIILRAGSSQFKYSVRVIAAGAVSNSVNVAGTTISSQTTINPPAPSGATSCALNFTDSGGTVQAAYLAGANVYVTLTDGDQNSSSNTLQSMSIVVKNNSRNDLETITLTETGTNTGIFRNTTALSTSTTLGTSQGDGILNVVAGDSLTVTNTDAVNFDVCTASAVVQAAASGKVLYLSSPGQSLDRVDPVATGDGTLASSTDIGSASSGGTSGLVYFDRASSNAVVATTNWVHITTNGANRLMLVGVAYIAGAGNASTGITYGGVSLTKVRGLTNVSAVSEIWQLINPPTGSNNVSIAKGASTGRLYAGAATFSSVDTNTPLSAITNASGTAAAASVTITSSTNEIVFDSLASDNLDPIVGTNNQTLLWMVSNASAEGGSASTKPGTNLVTMSWTAGNPWALLAVSVKGAAASGGSTNGPATNATTFVQTTNFCSNFIISSNNTIAITNYITLTNGSLTANPAVTATLLNGTTNILVMSSPTYNSTNSTLVWQGVLTSNVTVAAGNVITYVISNGVAGTAFHVDYDVTNKPSKIVLPTSTIISITNFNLYDAAYPGGNLVTVPTAGTTYYLRAAVADPFGSYDITSLGLTIDGPGTSGDVTTTLTNTVSNDGCNKVFEYVWTTINNPGAYNFVATANEGTEGITATATTGTTLIVLDLGTPSVTEFTFGDNGVSTNAYSVNSSACIRVTDLDQNLTNSVAENLIVTVTSSAGDSQSVTLTETTTNSGIFTSCLSVSTNATAITNTTILYAPAGSVLTVNYVDPTDSSDATSATATILTAPGVPGISMSKTLVTPASGQTGVGSTVTFNLQVFNTGSTVLTNVAVRDNYPSNSLSYVSATLTPSTTNLGVLTWTNIGNLAVGGSTNFNVSFTATNVASATNFATGSTTVTTNTTSSTVLVTRSAVTVTKTILSPTNSTVSIGSNVVFRLTVQNTGSTTLTNVPLSDTFSGATFTNVSATLTPNGVGSGSLLWTNIGPMVSNATVVIDVTLRVIGAANPANNTATADFVSDQFGNSVTPSTSTTNVITVAASVSGKVYNDIDQSGTLTTNDVGLNGVTLSIYTADTNGNPVTLVNITTSDSTGYYELLNLSTGRYVVVETDLPGYSSTAPVNNRLVFNLTTLTASTNNNFFDYQPSAAVYGSFTGTVWNDLNGNATNDVTEVGISNIVVDLVQDVNTNGLADVGEPVVSSATTGTNGVFSFTGVIPGNYVLRETDASGYYSTGDSVGANDNYIARTITPGGSSTNNSFFDHFNLAPVAVNDTNSTPVNVPLTLDPRTNDSDPDGNTLTITAATPTNGTVVINGGTNITFTPTTNFNGVATIGYTISDGHGGTASAIIFITVNASADVSISKSAAGSVTAGQNLTYTITVTNAGPSVATNVIASDALPANVAFVSATSGGTSNNGAVTWPSIAALASGGSTNFTLVVTAPAFGTSLTNFASVTNSTPDPTPTNNTTPPVVTTVGASADVSVSKSGPASVTASQNITYTITITNAGPSTATNAIASDTLPANVAFVSASGSGTSNNGAVTWPSTNLTSGASASYTLVVTAPAFGTSLTNFAAVTNSTPDPTPTNNLTPPVITTVNASADVSVSKSAAASVTAGQNLTYTITITNAGPSTATNAIASDTLPANVAFVSASGSGTSNNGAVTWPSTNLSSGSSASYTLIVAAPNFGASLTNFAAVTNSTPDPTPTNNLTPPVITTVNASADVSITKTAPGSVTAAQNLTYTITVTNAGPSTATNVIASDTLPSNGIFVSASSGGTTNAGIVTWPTIATLASGASANFTVVVTAPASGSLTNVASVTNSTPEPTLTNNVTPPVITTVGASADVSVSKSAVANVTAGQNLTYTITVTNAGPSVATNVIASDTLPSGVLFVSATSGGTSNNGAVTWPSIATLASGASTNFTLVVTAPTFGASLTNFAAVTNSTPDPTPTNNLTPPVITTVNPLADVSITKSATNLVTAAQNLTYTVIVTNAGPSTATNVIVTDTLPSTGTFVSASSGGTTNAGIVTWPTIATLASGGSTNFTVVVRAPATGSLTNTAAVTNSTPEPTLTNNVTPPVITAVAESADVSITKSATNAITAGQNLTYTIVVTNAGPSTATNVVASDTLPSGIQFVSATSVGTSNSGAVTWPSISLASGASTNYTLVVTVPTTGASLTNFASVTTPTPDPTPTNNLTPPVITTVNASADVSITKSGNASVTAAQNLTYTIVVTNAGPSVATNVITRDTLPTNGTFVSASGGGTTNTGIVTWPTIATLASGASTNFTVVITAPASGTLTNTANVTNSTPEPTLTNNLTPPVITSVGESADVSISKTANATVTAAQNLTYTIVVTNAGPSTATNVVASDTLPAGVTFVSATSGGTNASGTVTWPGITLTNRGSASYTLVVTAPATGTLTNFASVTTPTPDPTPTNNTTPPVITTVIESADVSVSKSAASTVVAGQNLTYTITVTNAGPSAATNVVPSDALPVGVTFVSATGSGTNASGTVTWPAIASLTNGGSASYTLVVTAPANSATLTNFASITTPTPDPTPTNNTTPPVITTVTSSADVSITKTGNAVVTAAQNLTYTIVVTNAGPSTATNVVATDTLPTNATFVSATGSGTNASGTVTWPTIVSLTNGGSASYTVTVTAPATGTLTNFASVTTPTPDPTPTNNTTPPVITTVTATADVSISKTAPATVTAAQNLTYTIIVTNAGPSTATNVIPSDTLPIGVTFVSASGSGTNNSGVVTWPTIATLTNRGSASYTLVVTAPATGTLTNFASVTNSTPEPTLTNNTTPPVITVVLESADVSVTKTAATNVTAGQNLAYTITVTNAGPSAATNVIPSDALPNGVAFVSATSGGTSNNGAVTWPAISSLSSGGSASYTLVVTAPANSATLTNFASVTTPTPDPTPTNNTTPPVITTVTPSADIAVTKSGPAGVALGTSFSYTIAVTNGGPSIATSLSVTDSLPAGLIFVSASPSATTNGSQVVWSFTNFAANFATNLTLTVNSTTRTTVTNFATGGSPVGDPNLTNNTGGPVVTAITNRPPVANPDSTNTLKNVTVVINPLPNDTDPDNDPLTITSATSTNGIVTFTGTNVTFTPNTNFTGAATITYTISDGNGGTATGTITVNVANQPPIAVNDTNSTPRNIAITLDPRANDSDPDNDPLTITFASPTNGTVVINGGTNITFTPATNFQGTATIGYTISDGANSTNAVIFISVTNRPPTAVNDSTNTVKNVAVVINPLPNDTDADGDTLTITNAVATNGVVTFTGTNITFTPTTNFVGVATVTYTITDGFGGSSTATIFVTVSNQPPTAVDDNYSTPKNVAITVNPRVNDTDPDNDPLTITSVSATNGVATIIGGTNVLFTPLTNFLGTATIGYTITDGLATTNALITISITNRPPVANPDTTNTLKNVTVVIRPLVNDTDPDGDPLTITNAVSTNGVVTFTGTNITFVPNTNFTGSATITYTITDGNGGSSTTNITVNVANQPPIAVNDTNSTPRNIAITLDPRTNDSDPDGDPLTITFASPTNGTVVINGGTNITFTPATNFLGVATIGYTISDGTSSTNAIIFISVTNRPPVAVNDTNSIPKNTTLTFDPRTNDTDADGDVLTIVSVNATNGTAQIIGGTNVAFTPTTNFIGTATIGYTIIDGFGGTNSAVIFISVTNRPPVAVNDTNSTPKNIALTINPRVNDTDPDNDPLIITSVSVTNGTAQIIGGTNILFTPATNFVGIATIGYTISDGTTNATALITVSVTNRPPTAVSDSYSTPRNVAITVDPRTNDTDPDNDALTLMSVTTTNGTVSFTGTNVTFTPATNFQGTVTLPYSITDGFGATNSAVITVSITNRPPLAVNDSTNTFPNVAVTVRPLGNDSDADGDTLTIISVSATNGTAQIIGGTNVVVTPATNFTGAVTVGYTIIDGFGGTNSAVITVIAGSRPPVAVNDTNSTPRNVAVTIRPLLNDSDPDNDVLTVTSVSPTNGTAQIIGGTNVLFTPATNFVGLATIGYTITDGFYTTNATIFVTVSNRPPIAVNDVTTGNAFIQKTISVLTNDSDPDGDTLILVSVTTTNGTASVNGNNVLFTPNKLSGVAYATYTISDGHGGTNSALVIIAINNTAPVAVNDTYGVPRNTTLTFDPRVNDTDANSDPLTITSVTATNGSVSFTGTSVTYTPVSNFLGTVYLPYTITDGAASSSALITINITNRPPVALNDTNNYTTANTPVTVRPLLNDSDPDLDPLTVITVTPTNGTAQIVGGTNVVFTPATNFTGLATIGYKISDGHGGTNSALIYVNVNPGTPSLADVAVFMSGPTNVIAGNAIVYTITVTNMGPQPATNVILVDTLPPGTYFVSTVVTGGITNGIVTWPTIGVLPAGGTTNYTLTLYTTNLGYITNVAYASSVTPDPNLVNNNGTLPASQARTLVNPFAYTYGATNIFNPQTGLYEETVTVTNTGGTAIAAMRVYATGLPATVILQNSIGTSNGAPFVQYNGGLVPGQVVTFLLEFLSTDRRPFTNGIIIEGTLPIYGSTNAGTFVTNIVIFSETYPGTLTPHQVVEFATIPGHVYTILYSDDGMDTWSVATPTLTATANVVQWIDSGPPKTVTKPANRFYQVIQSP